KALTSGDVLITNRLQLLKLTIRDKGVTPVSMGGSPPQRRYVAQIEADLATATNFNPTAPAATRVTWTPSPTRYFEVPVTVQSGKITSCGSNLTMADYCAETGGTWTGSNC